ncbi:MAG: response regulator [Anaerolineales bacterium]|nr:response regulator [Anaerolineales bacterium]
MTTTYTILVVEDNLGIQHLITTGLRRAGYEVITARSGAEAINQFTSNTPDLVLMDILMPGMDGFEATQRIRILPNGSTVPVIFLTSVGDVESRIRGLNLGADDYLVKPIKMGEFLARIQSRLRKRPSNIGKIISIFGSQTGEGATTLTVNLACALQKVSGKRILLIDGQQPKGDMARMLQISGKIRDTFLPYDKSLDEMMFTMALHPFTDSIQFLAGTAAPMQSDQQRLDWYSRSKLYDIALHNADFVLVDAGDYFLWQDPPIVQVSEGINICIFTQASNAIDRAGRIKNSPGNQDIHNLYILNRYVKGSSPIFYESRLGTIPDGFAPDDLELLNENNEPLYNINPNSPYSRAIEDIAIRIEGI